MQTDVLDVLKDETRPADMAPRARMAVIRRLTKAANDAAVEAGRSQDRADALGLIEATEKLAGLAEADALWTKHDQIVTDLLECLHQAELAGDLAVCEAALG